MADLSSGQKAPQCSREHRLFVAETVACEGEGTATVVRVCLECPHIIVDKVQVAEPGARLRLSSLEKSQNK